MGVYVPGGGGGGNPAYTVQTVTSSTTLSATGNLLVLANSASGAITITLPASASNSGATIIIKRTTNNGNNITVAVQGADTIDGDTSRALNYSPGGEAYAGNQYLQCVLVSTGAGYIDSYNNILAYGGVHGGPAHGIVFSADGSGVGSMSLGQGGFGGISFTSQSGVPIGIPGGVQTGYGQAVAGGNVLGGSGVPSNAVGNNGDLFVRTDTPATTNQRLYNKQAGAWVGIL